MASYSLDINVNSNDVLNTDIAVLIDKHVEFGSESDLATIVLSHNYPYGINNVKLFLSPVDNASYIGDTEAGLDLRQLLELGSNYPNHGLTLYQTYTATGYFSEAQDKTSQTQSDLNRYEPLDIFANQILEIVSETPNEGQKKIIESYDWQTKTFTFRAPSYLYEFPYHFGSGAGTYDEYQIEISQTDYFTLSNGSSIWQPISLLHGGGTILSEDTVTLQLSIKLPSHAQKFLSNTFMQYFVLNVTYNELAGDLT